MILKGSMYPIQSHPFFEHSLSQTFLISAKIIINTKIIAVVTFMTCTPGKLSSAVCLSRKHWRRGRCTQCFLVITMRSVDDDNNDDDDDGNVDDGMNDESTLDCSFEECLASLT